MTVFLWRSLLLLMLVDVLSKITQISVNLSFFLFLSFFFFFLLLENARFFFVRIRNNLNSEKIITFATVI